MAKTKRSTYSAKFKSRVAIDALRERNTIAQLAHKHSVHGTLVGKWKNHALKGIPGLFVDGRSADAKGATNRSDERLVRELYEQVGRLKMEIDWLKKKLGS